MTTEELEAKLEGQTESQNLEFKGDVAWDVKSIIKDVLAMSNLQDGGYIILGINDKSLERIGISSANMETYNYDIMKDQIAPYADPFVDFRLYFPKDKDGKDYVVIRIFPFRQIPTICRKDGADVRAGVIYYRNNNGRPQSAAVSNSNDMRDIIEVATLKMMQKKKEIGFTAEVDDKSKLDKELMGL
ncbi:MAG: ATP-binding protein [Candidatus Paceibacterota bacterium]